MGFRKAEMRVFTCLVLPTPHHDPGLWYRLGAQRCLSDVGLALEWVRPGGAGEQAGSAPARTAPAGSWSACLLAGCTARALCSGTLAGEAASGRLCLASLLACGQVHLSRATL